MLYVARDGAGDITAICNNPTTAENLRALIDDSIEEVPTAGAAEDYVFTINGKAGSQHIATNEAEVVDFITSTPGIEFKKDSQFYGLPQDEAMAAIQIWLDDGHMANELTEELNGALVSEYRINTIYSKAAPMLEGRDIDTAFKEMYGRDYHETAEKEKTTMNQYMNEEPEMDEANIASMIASMEGYMEDVKEAAPAEAYEQIAAPAEELKQHIEDCRTAEECFGPEPAIWEGYQPKHEEVCDSLDNLSKTYQSENTSTEAKAVALDHSTAALKNANNYLVEQLTAVEQRNQDMLREMQELRQELADMRASVQGYSPEKFAQSMAVAIKFLEEANGIYKHAQQPGRNYGKLYKHTRRTVHKVYRDVIDTPKRIRNAVKDKAYSVVDSGIRKIARVFDKGLQSLQEKKDKLMEKSAAINEKRDAIYGRTTSTSQPESPAEDKTDNHLLDLNSLLKNENRDKAVSQLVDFLVKAGKKEEGITKILADVKVKATAEMKKPEYKAIQAEAAAAR